MKPIVVGVDGSEGAKAATAYAATAAKASGAPLLLVYVVPAHLPGGPQAYAQELTRWQEICAGFGRKVLAEAAAAHPELAGQLRTIETIGDAPETLAQLAEDEDAQMVVVGLRGHGQAPTLMGGVAYRLVQLCKRPVLVFR